MICSVQQGSNSQRFHVNNSAKLKRAPWTSLVDWWGAEGVSLYECYCTLQGLNICSWSWHHNITTNTGERAQCPCKCLPCAALRPLFVLCTHEATFQTSWKEWLWRVCFQYPCVQNWEHDVLGSLHLRQTLHCICSHYNLYPSIQKLSENRRE